MAKYRYYYTSFKHKILQFFVSTIEDVSHTLLVQFTYCTYYNISNPTNINNCQF